MSFVISTYFFLVYFVNFIQKFRSLTFIFNITYDYDSNDWSHESPLSMFFFREPTTEMKDFKCRYAKKVPIIHYWKKIIPS